MSHASPVSRSACQHRTLDILHVGPGAIRIFLGGSKWRNDCFLAHKWPIRHLVDYEQLCTDEQRVKDAIGKTIKEVSTCSRVSELHDVDDLSVIIKENNIDDTVDDMKR